MPTRRSTSIARIARRDWKAAIAELRRLEKRRPDRKEIAARIADVLARSGDPSAAAEQLSKALAKNPADAGTRLRIADHAYAKGDTMALRRALAEALQAGSKGLEIREAVELIEGASLLEPYRTNGRKVIKEFEAWEKSGKHMDGNAARVFDYAATWVHPDGSSEMLEHEILRMQSQEAVDQGVRAAAPGRPRPQPARHQAGRLDPRARERRRQADAHDASPRGRRLPRDRAHHRQRERGRQGQALPRPALVLPRGRQGLLAERVRRPHAEGPRRRHRDRRQRPEADDGGEGHVHRAHAGASTSRRPRAEEPDSPNPREFLPSVRVGWGINLDDTLVRYVDAATRGDPARPAPPQGRARHRREDPGREEGRARSRRSIAGSARRSRSPTRPTVAAPSRAAPARVRRRSCTSCASSASRPSSRS